MGVETTGPCRFCGKNAVLQNSHILPASAHRNTKQNGRNVLLASGNGIFKRNNQTDFTDLLLCFTCEQEFSKFEGVAIEACRVAWRVGADLKLTHRADPNLTQGGVLHS